MPAMPADPRWYASAVWTVLVIVWIAAAFGTKRTEKSASRGSRLIEICLLVPAFALLFQKKARIGPLEWRVAPAAEPVEWSGVAITIAGIAGAAAHHHRLAQEIARGGSLHAGTVRRGVRALHARSQGADPVRLVTATGCAAQPPGPFRSMLAGSEIAGQ